jgi:uncharacterized Tic20 family protein
VEITNGIIQVIDKLSEKFGIAFDWSSQNVMPYIEELGTKIINFKIATSWVWIIISILLLLLSLVFLFISIKRLFSKKYNDFSESDILFVIISSAFSIFSFVLIGIQVYTIVTCYTLPEIIIFEYVQDLIYSISQG